MMNAFVGLGFHMSKVASHGAMFDSGLLDAPGTREAQELTWTAMPGASHPIPIILSYRYLAAKKLDSFYKHRSSANAPNQ